MKGKSEVYSWRISPALKVGLEEAARREGRTMSRLLDDLAAGFLAEQESPSSDEEQRKLQARAGRFVGRLSGGDPRRASRSKALVRARLRRRRAR